MPATSRATLTIISKNGSPTTTLKITEPTGTTGEVFHAEEASLGIVVEITLDQEGEAGGTGQANIISTGTNFTEVGFSFVDPYLGTEAIEIDPGFDFANGTSFTVTGFDQFGIDHEATFTIKNGENRFTIESDAIQYITGVTISTAPDALIDSIKQIRIGDVVTAPVPEPSTVAMALTGFGVLGVAGLRRLRRRARVDA